MRRSSNRLVFVLISVLWFHQSFASLEWLSSSKHVTKKVFAATLITPQGMPVFGYSDSTFDVTGWEFQTVYNLETDGGYKDHIINKARWQSIIDNKISHRIYFPKVWYAAEVFLNLPSGIELLGDDSSASQIRLLNTTATNLQTSGKNVLFVSYGSSNISVHDLRITTGNHRMQSVFLFNAMKTGNDDIAKSISLNRVKLDSNYATPIKFGGRSPGQTTHIIDVSITNSEIGFAGNPLHLYNIEEDAPDTAKCHAIDLGTTVYKAYIFHNKLHDCSGDGINSNLTTHDASVNYILPREAGNYTIDKNEIYNTYSGIVIFGSYAQHPRITGNYIHNWTGNGYFGISYDGMYGWLEGNRLESYECRPPYEIYGIGNHFDFGNTDIFLKRNANRATWATKKPGNTVMALTAGYGNSYYGTIKYNNECSASPNTSDNRYGIIISGQATLGYQPQVWEGKNYPNGYTFHCRLYNFTGNAIYADVVKQYDVNITSDCWLVTKFLGNQDVIKIAGKNWKVYCKIDATGSPSNSTAAAVSVNTRVSGTGWTESDIAPDIVYLPSANRLKNKELYRFKMKP